MRPEAPRLLSGISLGVRRIFFSRIGLDRLLWVSLGVRWLSLWLGGLGLRVSSVRFGLLCVRTGKVDIFVKVCARKGWVFLKRVPIGGLIQWKQTTGDQRCPTMLG